MMIQDSDASFASAGARPENQFLSMPENASMPVSPVARLPFKALSEDALRWLARTQLLNGSWGEDVERTSAALLAFVRSGHTTRAGSFRQALRRAVEWLAAHPGDAFAAQARARALQELAAATREPRHAALAAQAVQPPLPPTPGLPLSELDKLRQAALAGTRLSGQFTPPQDEPGLTWYILTL
jgi:hypothetical protein